MKKFILSILLMVLGIQLNAQNYSYFENDLRFYKNKTRVTFTHYGEFEINEKFGIADYVFVTSDWGEFTIGPYWKFNKRGLVAVLPGIETLSKFRIGFYGYYKFENNFTVSAFYEKGVIDYFDYQLRKDHEKWFYILRARQDYGIGIPVGYKFQNFHFMYATYYNFEKIGEHKFLPTFSLNLEF